MTRLVNSYQMSIGITQRKSDDIHNNLNNFVIKTFFTLKSTFKNFFENND